MYIVPKETLHAQTVKLTLHHRATASLLERRIVDPNPNPKCNAKSAIYRHSSVETNQTARISLQLSINVKQHCHPEAKNKTDAPIPQRARPDHPSNAAVSPARPAVSPTRQQHLSAAGEGRSRPNQKESQAQNTRKFEKSSKPFIIIILNGKFQQLSLLQNVPTNGITTNKSIPSPIPSHQTTTYRGAYANWHNSTTQPSL